MRKDDDNGRITVGGETQSLPHHQTYMQARVTSVSLFRPRAQLRKGNAPEESMSSSLRAASRHWKQRQLESASCFTRSEHDDWTDSSYSKASQCLDL